MREWDLRPSPRGLRLRICEWGNVDGRPTLVLHGFLEQGAAWNAVAGRLDGRIVAPDHRGHGLSGHVGQGGFYHFWDYLGDVDAIVDAIVEGVGAPVDLVGHSMGSTMAAWYAGLRPNKVRRLVLVEGLGPPSGDGLERPRSFLDHQRSPPRHKPLADLDDATSRMRRFNPALSEVDARMLAARTTRPFDDDDPEVAPGPGTLVWTWDPLHRARSPQPFVEAIFAETLRAITAPVLLVVGADSPFRLPGLEAREAHLGEHRKVVVPGAGHLVHHDAPDALAALIGEHLAR